MTIFLFLMVFSMVFLPLVSAFASPVVKADIGMQIQAGKVGRRFPNSIDEVFIHDGTDPLWTLQDTKDRFGEIKANLDTLLGTDMTVLKMNYPAFTDIVSETAASNVEIGTLKVYCKVRMRDGGINSEPLYVTFVGVPLYRTSQELYDALVALFTDALGFCADGVTPRYVEGSLTPVESITVSAMKKR